jgi:hypothetical protein
MGFWEKLFGKKDKEDDDDQTYNDKLRWHRNSRRAVCMGC